MSHASEPPGWTRSELSSPTERGVSMAAAYANRGRSRGTARRGSGQAGAARRSRRPRSPAGESDVFAAFVRGALALAAGMFLALLLLLALLGIWALLVE